MMEAERISETVPTGLISREGTIALLRHLRSPLHLSVYRDTSHQTDHILHYVSLFYK
jgi:hypothetical protein